jgi:hypothetical protein
MGDEEKKPDLSEAINLKVVTQDGNEIFFKVGASSSPPPPRLCLLNIGCALCLRIRRDEPA